MRYIKKEYLAKFCQKNKKERDTNVTHTLTADRRLFANDILPFSFFFFAHPGQSPPLCVNRGEPGASSARAGIFPQTVRITKMADD